MDFKVQTDNVDRYASSGKVLCLKNVVGDPELQPMPFKT